MSCGLFSTKWSVDEVHQWLITEGIPNVVADVFKSEVVVYSIRTVGVAMGFLRMIPKEKVDGEIICCLDERRILQMGINDESSTQLCLDAIKKLRKQLQLLKSKIFQDPIHGPIELHPLLVSIIDTPQFQRLRDIKQLGGVYYVFPGASHNRFEHSIGVCYLAGEFIDSLRQRQPELGIDDCDVLCVKIAALCHDMGHGPFSHLYQDLFIPAFHKDRNWKHEEASIKLMGYMMQVNEGLSDKFKQYGLDWERDKPFIEELIFGKPKEGNDFKGRDKQKHFLYEIVANQVNGIDVDKMDYLLRDSHGLGITVHFDWRRYFKFARVVKDENDQLHICPRNKVVRDVYEFFNIRDRLSRAAYQHKTKRALEFMFLDAMMKVDNDIKIIRRDGVEVKMSEAIDDMEAFTKLTDGIIHLIGFYPAQSEEIKEAQQILQDIQQRRLYMYIGKTLIANERMQSPMSDWKEDIILKAYEDTTLQLDESKLKLEMVTFDYGSGQENPVDKVWFYTKERPDKPVKIRQTQVSAFLPKQFDETEYRLYYMKHDPEAQESIKKGFRKFCKTNKRALAGEEKDGVHSPLSLDGVNSPLLPTPVPFNNYD